MFQEFFKPATVAEAVELRRRHPASAYVAGGTEINSRAARARIPAESRPDRAIGIAHLPLGGIERSEEGVRVGANAVVQELVANPDVPGLLAQAAAQFANRNIRNMATLGGNLATHRSCSNLVPALLALDARVHLATGDGETALPVEDYLGLADPTALILAVTVPRARLDACAATRKHGRTANDLSILSVAVAFEGSPERLERAVVAVGGVAATATRLRPLEERLEGAALPDRDTLEAWARPLLHPIDDLRGGAAYKRQVAAALVGWALHRAAASRGGRA